MEALSGHQVGLGSKKVLEGKNKEIQEKVKIIKTDPRIKIVFPRPEISITTNKRCQKVFTSSQV